MQKRINNEGKELIRKLSKDGMSNKEITKTTGYHISTVQRYSYNKRKTVTPEKLKEIKKLFYDNVHKETICKITGFSIAVIHVYTKGLVRDEGKVIKPYKKLKSTPKPLPPKKRKTEVRKEDTEDMRKFSRKDPLDGRVKVKIKPGLWAYIKNDERFEERLERQKQLHLNNIL